MSDIKDFNEYELVEELERRNFDFLKQVDDCEIREEYENRGLVHHWGEVDETNKENKRLRNIVNGCYYEAVYYNTGLENLIKYIEKNCKL